MHIFIRMITLRNVDILVSPITFIFSHNSFELLPHEFLYEVCFAVDTLINIICFSNISANLLNLQAVYC